MDIDDPITKVGEITYLDGSVYSLLGWNLQEKKKNPDCKGSREHIDAKYLFDRCY